MKLFLERTQYGVGQGCFHVQRLAMNSNRSKSSHWIPNADLGRPFDVVYDCGSAPSQTVGGTKPLDWAVEHYRPSKDGEADSIDVVYLSHFQMDHINGLQKLRIGIGGKHSKKIQLLIVPHLNADMAWSVLAQQAAVGYGADLVILQQFVDALGAVVRGDDVLGIPTMQISPGRRDTNRDPETDPNELPPEWGGRLVSQADNLRSTEAGGLVWNNPQNLTRIAADSTAFELAMLTGVGGHLSSAIWQLKTWCWKQSKKITSDIVSNLKMIAGFPTSLFMGPLSSTVAVWIVDNAAAIQAAYRKAIYDNGIPHSSDHNVVSLCLYSGPADTIGLKRVYPLAGTPYWMPVHGARDVVGWLGTGDALLGSKNVWKDFSDHFGSRISEARTVYVPHHGSGSRKPGNFAGELFDHGPVAVVSAGAFNSYHHPASWVLSSLAARHTWPVVVTEMMRPGYVESFAVHF